MRGPNTSLSMEQWRVDGGSTVNATFSPTYQNHSIQSSCWTFHWLGPSWSVETGRGWSYSNHGNRAPMRTATNTASIQHLRYHSVEKCCVETPSVDGAVWDAFTLRCSSGQWNSKSACLWPLSCHVVHCVLVASMLEETTMILIITGYKWPWHCKFTCNVWS